ncbi:MAG TPA: FG-GAP-like repeat-containing protein, partial [Ornithinibacter sp.]|nr:FG-GAP-like repeat-containing protein [Ornithinibacter sp.]
APLHDNGQGDEGKVYVYLGSANGPATSPSWTVESNQVGADFGTCVAGAGDVNGDGFADVIIGADSYDNGQANEGRAFVYHGSATGLATSPSWVAESNQDNAYFAQSVAAAGDVNADGYADVIVGAAQYSNGQPLEGRAYIYLGTSSGLATSASWITESNQVDAHFGRSVATAGDANGDGFADVIIGVNEYDNGQNDEGRVVVFNGAWPTPGNTPAWSVESNQVNAGLGNVVATAGDVNGDGLSDIIVASSAGTVQVYHGSSASLHPMDAFRISPVPGARFGHAVAAAGDVNGDGLFDFIVGAPGYGQDAGRAYVFDIIKSGFSPLDAGQAFAQFGNSVAMAGDVNGDGFSDVIVGANHYENGQISEGRAFVYHGSASGPGPSASWTAESNQAFAEFGYAVASAGDVNGDGYSDVIVGAYAYDNGQDDEGRVSVYHGSANGLSSSPAWRAESNQASSGFGYSVATAGDVNRDGYSDVIVGAYLYDNGQTNEGRVFVYHGSATGLASSPAWTAESNQAIADFGIAVATAGDVNGDGYSDVIIGAPSYDNGQDGEGRAFVYLGSSTGLRSSPAWTAEANVLSAQFGFAVGTAGDVNGDGYSDVVIGAPFLTNGASDEGGAFVYQGWEGGLAANPAWNAEGNQAIANFGFAVASGGDMNGDGFSDVIVGAPVLDNQPGDDQGFCLGYYGNWDPSGFSNPAIRRIQQARVDNTAAIHIQGNSDYQTAFRLKGLGSSAAGRNHVWLEWEVKPLGAAFNGQGIVAGQVKDTGVPMGPGSIAPLTEVVSGLVNNTRYCWRARVASRSPFFPRGPWLMHAGNALREADLRTTGHVIGITASMPAATPRLLEPIHPNPFESPGEIRYSLPEDTRVRLAVYDVQGRLRAVLDQGLKSAGRHAVVWDGRAVSGARLQSGVYLVRLELGDRTETRKLVWAP